MPNLPIPSDAALAHSQLLVEHIQQEIHLAGGLITFARFMELALYAPGLGYYSAGNHKLGAKGDFLTAPEISPLFARCIARQCQQIFGGSKDQQILEIGAGSGKLAGDLLSELESLNTLPSQYFILEISADLRARQQDYLQTAVPQLFSRITWLDSMPDQAINGIILANEVMDALSVNCFRMTEAGIQERCVTVNNQAFEWCYTSSQSAELTEQIQMIQEDCALSVGYESEANLLLRAWINTLQNALKNGLILLFDYGYARKEFYHPDRRTGTLMCYYQHRRHDNPFLLPGLQDITAHVDFTTVAECTLNTDLHVAGFTTQGAFLLSCGLLDMTKNDLSTQASYQQNQAIKLLTLPAQMGELIKVIALTKDIDASLLGFRLQDRRQDL